MNTVNSTAGIGLYGGTFDPVHETHLALARFVRDRFALDQVLLIPALEPPHKHGAFADFSHRAAMLELALASEPDCQRLVCSRIEADLPTPSYTIRTVTALRGQYPESPLFLVMGLDMLAILPTWRQSEELLAQVNLLVLGRDAVTPEGMQDCVCRLRPVFTARTANLWINAAGKSLHLVPDFHHPHSSTAIRAALTAGQEAEGLPPVVREYIRQHGLYREPGRSPFPLLKMS